jgi:uncharacterized protein YegL
MVKDLILRRKDLIDNPAARVPVCLVLDCSPSMTGETCYGAVVEQTDPSPIDELNDGVALFFDQVKEDEVARYSCEAAVVAFSAEAEVLLDFGSMERAVPPAVRVDLEKVGGTSIGSAVNLALKLLDRRKGEYKDTGVDYFQPWMVLMTDGRPTDSTHLEAAAETARRVQQKKLHVFPLGIGRGADMSVLAMFSPATQPLRLKGLRFKDFFQWLSASVNEVSRSVPGENVQIDLSGAKSWQDI